MLTLTDSAGTVVSTIVARATTTDTAGLRIQQGGEDRYDVAVVDAPEAADVAVEHQGAKVYMPDEVATTLDDKVLDASVGDDGSVRFAIAQQA